MRFSALHLLLLGTAFAAPIQDVVEQTSKRSDSNSLIARGLVPVLPRNPVFVAPRGVAPRPVTPVHPNTPDAPPRPVPHDPANPSTNPVDDTPGLVPNKPADPANPNPVDDTPGLIPNDPATPPVDAPNVPVTQPGTPNAPQPNRPGTSKDTPEALPAAEDSAWAQKGIEKDRVKGYQAQKKLDEAIEGKIPDKGFKGDLNVKYKVDSTTPTAGEIPKKDYIQDPRFEGAFDFTQEGAKISRVKNNEAQIKAVEEWALKEVVPKKMEKDPFRTQEEIEAEVKMQAEFYEDIDMLTTMENPKKGGMIIKDSANKDNDFYRDGNFANDENFPRPGVGGGKDEAIGWTDQTMALWRQSVAKTPGAKVTDLRFMGRDSIVTPRSQEVLLAVQGQMKKKPGEGFTVRRTGGDAAEQAGYDAIASTVHGQRPIQMAADHHVELGDLKVNAFHVFSRDGNPATWDMVIEFGH
jgi:hypothetical protein